MKKVVVITGGSRGIGAAISRSFADDGNTVVVNYSRSAEDAELLGKELSGAKGQIILEKADVSVYAEAKQLVDNAVKKCGRIDVLVNNAGITRDGFLMLMSEKDWQDVINVNLTGTFNCSKAVCEHMIGRRSGVIINVASLSGIAGLAGQTNYAASKGGVIAFTKSLSRELARFGIRVNAVAPGMIETDITDSLKKEDRDRFLENIPLNRFGRPDEVASVVKFLSSDGAGYITGETINITGGLH